MFSAFAGTCIFMKCATRNELKRKIHKKCNNITKPRTKQHTVIQDYLKMDWMCSLFFFPCVRLFVFLFRLGILFVFFLSHRIFHSVVIVFRRNIWFVGSFFGLFPTKGEYNIMISVWNLCTNRLVGLHSQITRHLLLAVCNCDCNCSWHRFCVSRFVSRFSVQHRKSFVSFERDWCSRNSLEI